MNEKNKQFDSVPEEFSSYDEAAEFWDKHDTTEYEDIFEDIEVHTEFRKRHFEVEVDEDVMKELLKQSRNLGVPTKRLANDWLRKQMCTIS